MTWSKGREVKYCSKEGLANRARPAEISHWSEMVRERRVLRFVKESLRSQSEGKGLNQEKIHSDKNMV